MAAWNSSTVVAAGVGLLFGLCGGIAGALWVGAQPSVSIPSASSATPASVQPDPALRDALTDLSHEVRALHGSLTSLLAEPTRHPAQGGTMPDVERLVSALEGFAKIANASPATAAGAHRLASPLILPDRPRDEGLLLELARTDYDARSRRYRFLTYQQVLDKFGRPDDVYENGAWHYELPESDSLTFNYFDGMLINIE